MFPSKEIYQKLANISWFPSYVFDQTKIQSKTEPLATNKNIRSDLYTLLSSFSHIDLGSWIHTQATLLLPNQATPSSSTLLLPHAHPPPPTLPLLLILLPPPISAATRIKSVETGTPSTNTSTPTVLPCPSTAAAGPTSSMFLRYLDQFGKTKVHNQMCPFFGNPSPPSPCPCPQAGLGQPRRDHRAAFEENGGKPEANPFGDRTVRLYLREVRDTPAKARGISYDKKKRKRPPPPHLSSAAVSTTSPT